MTFDPNQKNKEMLTKKTNGNWESAVAFKGDD